MEGIDWRGWSAADFAAVTFLMLKRQYADDPTKLRDLFELVGDTDAVAALDRGNMGQGTTVEVADVPVRAVTRG